MLENCVKGGEEKMETGRDQELLEKIAHKKAIRVVLPYIAMILSPVAGFGFALLLFYLMKF